MNVCPKGICDGMALYCHMCASINYSPPVTSVATECPHCKPAPDAVNHVPGHIFVGFGIGWRPCIHCGGSCKVPT